MISYCKVNLERGYTYVMKIIPTGILFYFFTLLYSLRVGC